MGWNRNLLGNPRKDQNVKTPTNDGFVDDLLGLQVKIPAG